MVRLSLHSMVTNSQIALRRLWSSYLLHLGEPVVCKMKRADCNTNLCVCVYCNLPKYWEC